jgi:pilus assembly protein CpaE
MGERDPQKLARIISGTLENDEAGGPMSAREKGIATIISVMGVKGGVGTSTVATNLAAALTERGTVILAELRPTFGSLGSHFRPGRMVPGLSSKWDADVAGMRSRVAAALWPVPSVPRLRILFGPQTPLDCGEINPERIATLLRILAAEADFLVTDLPASLDPSNREILSRSHYMALVMEPARACMGLAKLTLEGINMWEKAPRSISAVIVKRTAEGSPLPLAEIEAELGIPMQCVIPPAPELWLRGERTRVPLIQCDADSLAADTFFTMSREYPLQTMRLVGKPLH